MIENKIKEIMEYKSNTSDIVALAKELNKKFGMSESIYYKLDIKDINITHLIGIALLPIKWVVIKVTRDMEINKIIKIAGTYNEGYFHTKKFDNIREVII